MASQRPLHVFLLVLIILVSVSAGLPVVAGLAGAWPSIIEPLPVDVSLSLPVDANLPLTAGPSQESVIEAAAPPIAASLDPLALTSQLSLANTQILAFYGKPGAASMGILGEYPKAELAPILQAYADLYADLNGDTVVVPAFYIIYGTCWPEGEIGLTATAVVEDYIAFAAERGWLVFLDHQIGRYSVESAVSSMLPFLRHPNVHLAIDPEWRTTRPMQEIGTVSAEEVNRAQAMIEAYLIEHRLPGKRMLVVHQFHPRMLVNPELVLSSFDRVLPIHTADGIGSPELKRYSYNKNAVYTNLPYKGFKLFLPSKVAGATWDRPLMSPEEVLSLDPPPVVIMYQ